MFLLYLVPIALLAAAIAAYVLMKQDKDYNCMLCSFLGFASLMIIVLTGILYAWFSWSWVGSQHQANIINREYNTNYTREEIFFASSSIETIQHLNRKRFQVDGDLMRDAPDKK